MNREVIKRWVAALRSGEYEQVKGELCVAGGFCSLGVLCELHRREFGGTWEDSTVWSRDTPVKRYLGEWSSLPKEVGDWAGLKSTTPTMMDGFRPVPLTELNDGLELSFEQIADLIEQQWLVQEGANE